MIFENFEIVFTRAIHHPFKHVLLVLIVLFTITKESFSNEEEIKELLTKCRFNVEVSESCKILSIIVEKKVLVAFVILVTQVLLELSQLNFQVSLSKKTQKGQLKLIQNSISTRLN